MKFIIFSKFSKFFYGGIINYLIKISLTYFLTEILKIWYLYSYILALVFVIIFSFNYNTYITFKVKDNQLNNFVKYLLIWIIFIVFDPFLVWIFTDLIKFYYLISIIIVTTLLFFMKYLIYNKLIFVKINSERNKGGNFFNKFKSKNPFIKFLLRRFHHDLFYFIKKTKIKNFLDVGCGEGYTTNLIKKRFPQLRISAIEFDGNIVKKANKIHPNLHVRQGDIYDVNFLDDSFDIVFASEVLEHLEDPHKAIEECRRVSKKYCIFTVPNEPWWRIANMVRFTYLSRFGNTPGHIQHWSKKGLGVLLRKHFKKVWIKNSLLWNIALCKK